MSGPLSPGRIVHVVREGICEVGLVTSNTPEAIAFRMLGNPFPSMVGDQTLTNYRERPTFADALPEDWKWQHEWHWPPDCPVSWPEWSPTETS